MKKIYLFAAAALALASCTDSEYLGGQKEKLSGNGEISFGTLREKTTRADFFGSEAAEKLNGNFIVYGFKTASDEVTSGGDQPVFQLYNVNYEEGSKNTTESNTANWEYVGFANHDGSIQNQTIKYWDLSANSYVFSAVSGVGITAEKMTSGFASNYDKGWTVTIPAGGDLSSLYASNRVVMTKSGSTTPTSGKVSGKFQEQVNLTFYNLATKIRFAMYETVPGYEVHVDKFYYDNSDWKNTETNFAINGTFKTANKSAVTPLTITYYDAPASIENRPKVTYQDGDVTTGTYGTFGANIQATSALGTTSAEATYDQSDKSYTMILPYESQQLTTPEENEMALYVDYTLTSTDGSGETIKVKHASAKVPTNFNQWKPNFAYTYIFKISDNTNGTTGTPGDPNDPTIDPTDPAGLFPITFDAVVVGTEDGIQETITSVADPSITTYQKGVVVTANDEYTADDDIYFENGTANVAGYKVYEVNNFGSIENITEEVVANYINNFCVLTEVAVTNPAAANEDFIPLSDGTYIKKSPTQAGKFTPVAGKTYAIANGAGQYKVVKVVGTPANRTYTLTQATNGSDVIAAWTDAAAHSVHYQMLSDNTATDKGAFGAKSLIRVSDSSDNDVTANFDIDVTAIASIYSIKPNMEALAAGKIAYDDKNYTVKAAKDATVIATAAATFNINYTVAGNTATIVAGENKDITPTIGGATITKATITGVPAGITIEETSAGTYNVKVAPTVANGDYNITFAGATVTITVDSYAFYNVPEFTFNYLGTDVAKTLNLRKNFGDADVAVSEMTIPSGYESIATITKATAGAYTVVPVAPGTFTVEYKNTSATIVVNQYTLTAGTASIKKSTGSSVLILKKNNGTTKTVNASTAKVTVKKDASVVTSGFNLTTNGQTLKFSNVTTAGTYTFEYTEDTKVVAVATVTVTE